MIQYVINFILCSGLLLIIYRLFLQNERMYRFNRFYLLFSLVFSLMVPLITFTTTAKTDAVNYQQAVQDLFLPVGSNTAELPVQLATKAEAVPAAHLITPFIAITGLYTLVAVVLLGRFLANLVKIRRSIHRNKLLTVQNNSIVLTDDDVTPHSFLNYIFINRYDYSEGGIAPEIICHEQAHVKQWHSVDVLLIELFQAVCWFNPFIPFYRKAIQLNHEFLADEAVIEKYDNTPDYQYLLLAKSGQAHSLQLTSQFNYLTTKKRLIMMTKTTSAKMAWGKKLMLLPLAAACVFVFAQKIEAQTTKKSKATDEKIVEKPVKDHNKSLPERPRVKHAATDAPQSVVDAYTALLKKYEVEKKRNLKDITPADKAQLEDLFLQMSRKQQDDQLIGFGIMGKPAPKNKTTAAQLAQWQSKDYFIRMDDSNKRVTAEELAKYKPEDFDYSNVRVASAWSTRQNGGIKYFVDLMTKPYYAKSYKIAVEQQPVLAFQLKPVEVAR